LEGNLICFPPTLKEGKIIKDNAGFSKDVTIYLTYPTGWRFIKDHKTLKKDSLRMIFDTVYGGDRRNTGHKAAL
jgi:hypothetical protein